MASRRKPLHKSDSCNRKKKKKMKELKENKTFAFIAVATKGLGQEDLGSWEFKLGRSRVFG